jgi:curved DNA-binding protein CbpA
MGFNITIKWFVGAADQAALKKLLRNLGKTHHPDAGGHEETMKEINVEYEFLLKRNIYPVTKHNTHYGTGRNEHSTRSSGYGRGSAFSGFSGFDDFFGTVNDLKEQMRRKEAQVKAEEARQRARETYMRDEFFNDTAFRGFAWEQEPPKRKWTDPRLVMAHRFYTEGYTQLGTVRLTKTQRVLVRNACGFALGCGLKNFSSVKAVIDVYLLEKQETWTLDFFYHLCKESGLTAEDAAEQANRFKI